MPSADTGTRDMAEFAQLLSDLGLYTLRGSIFRRTTNAPALPILLPRYPAEEVQADMAQYVYTMNRVGKVVPPKREILKDISLSFFPRSEERRVGKECRARAG